MINTLNIKQAQLRDGFFTVGSGKEVMLIMGSCRVAPYIEYFKRWNEQNDNRFTIYSIDPFNFNWDINDNRVDYLSKLKALETDEGLLTMLKSVDVFIHEWYQNAGMFNCDMNDGNSIYSFGMKPKIDICIPNWNDVFVLFNDIVSFDYETRVLACQDYNVIGKLSEQTKKKILDLSQQNLAKFYNVCLLSDVPEMIKYYFDNHKEKRFFWSYNHVSKHFTLAIFKFINDKFLHLNLTDEFIEEISHEDMFANNYTYLTQYDIDCYGYEWDEEIRSLRDKL